MIYLFLICEINEVVEYLKDRYDHTHSSNDIPYILQIGSGKPIPEEVLQALELEYPEDKYYWMLVHGDKSYERIKEIALNMIEHHFIFKKCIMYQPYDINKN